MLIIRTFLTFNLVILWYIIGHSKCESKNYCSAEFCNNSKQHIMCKFQTPGPTRNCINYEKLLNNEIEKQVVLDRINGRRNKVASGEIHSLPPAENMLKLEWNEELEVLAQRWADQCFKNNFSDVTDLCQDSENSTVGQNIGTIYGDAPGLTVSSLVDLWYMELLNLNSSSLRRYTPSSLTSLQHYDYFTQLVWAESSHVGCGGVKFKEINIGSNERKNRTVYRLICNFAPSGNIIGHAAYSDGVSCSRCPGDSHCDSEYPYLCSSNSHITLTELNDDFQLTTEYKYNFFDHANFADVTSSIATKLNEDQNSVSQNIISDNDTSFDFLSHLFDMTLTRSSNFKQTALPCKDFMRIDEFIELLKNKLRSDQSLKDVLMATTETSNPDHSFSDRTVVAIINQLYSKKETATMSKTTQDENVNSTLLANLVEAVIFRHSDKFSTTEDISLRTQNAPNVRPVKIQAELGEIKFNTEFTGHYFFPEEEEQTEQETTEFYDDLENLPVSEISLEIENLKRSRETKDFLEEILESEFMTENIVTEQPILNNNNVSFFSKVKTFGKIYLWKDPFSNTQQIKRVKREFRSDQSKLDRLGVFVKYRDLLKKIADDIRNLHLYDKFHCSSITSNASDKILYNYCYFVIIIHTLYININNWLYIATK